jgi:cell division protein FtsL
MATAANWHREEDTRRTGWRERTEAYRLRPVPNEDVFFYSKRVDNSRLVRPVNQKARKYEVRVMAGAFVMLLFVVGLTVPDLMNLMAGVQLQALRAEHDQLIKEHERIEHEEAQLMDPERMKAIARQRNMTEAAPSQMHYLNAPRPKEIVEAKLK